jgi:NitT/TauT family transport system permease protein
MSSQPSAHSRESGNPAAGSPPSRGRAANNGHVLRIALPIIVLALILFAWEAIVRIGNIPPYVLPAPSLILQTLIADGSLLWHSLLVTLLTTIEGFLLAAVGGIGLAVCSISSGCSNIRSIPMP